MRNRRNRDDIEQREQGPNIGILIAVVGLGVVVVIASIGLAVWFFVGGETNAQVIAKYRPRFANERAKLKRIAEKLPAPGAIGGDTLPANLVPPPIFDVPNKSFNTAILMAEICRDPDRRLKSPVEFDLGFFEDGYHTHLQWTGDQNPMVESAMRGPAKDLAQRFERSLVLQYLVIARPVRFNPPRAMGKNAFVGGELDLEVLLVDREAEKVLGGFQRSFQPDPSVLVTYRKDRDKAESMESFVYSNVYTKARAEVLTALRKGTGGTFVDRGK